MNEVWKEAFDFWKAEYKYWWDKQELEEAFPNMSEFAYATDELEAITTHFEIVDDRTKANCLMNATEIVSYFKSSMGLILSSKKVGEALKGLEALQVKVRTGKTVLTKYALNDLNKAGPMPIPNPMQPDKKVPFLTKFNYVRCQ